MSDQFAAELDELYVRVADARIGLRELRNLALADADDELKGRRRGPLATFLLSKGRLHECATVLHQGLHLVKDGVGVVELAGIKASLVREQGLPRASFGLASRLVTYAMDYGSSALGMALFDSAVAAYHCGNPKLAERRWSRVGSLTNRRLYRAMAAVNVARVATDRGDYRTAKELLQDSMSSETIPRTLKASQLIIMAKLEAAKSDFVAAARLQTEAIQNYSHRGALDRAQLTVDLVIYMLRAGFEVEAKRIIQSMGMLVIALEEERQKHAAAVVLRFMQAAAAGPMTTSVAKKALERLEAFSHEAPLSHSHGHSARQK